MKKWGTGIGILCAAMVLCSGCGNKNAESSENAVPENNDQSYDANLIFTQGDLEIDTDGIEVTTLCQNSEGIYGIQHIRTNDEDPADYSIIKLSGEDAGQKIELPNDDYEEYSDLSVDNSGNFYVVKRVYDLNEAAEDDESTDAKADESEDAEPMYLIPKQEIVKISPSGERVWNTPVNEKDEGDFSGLYNIVYAKNTGVVTLSKTGISIFEAETGGETRLQSHVLDDYVEGNYSQRKIYALRDGNLYLQQTDHNMNDVIYKYDTSKRDFSEVDGKYLRERLEGSQLFPGTDYDFYVDWNDGIYAFNLGDDTGVKVCDYNASDLILNNINYIAKVGADDFLISTLDVTSGKMDVYYSMLSKANADYGSEKETLTFAVHYISDDMRKAVSKFNKENDSCRIVIKDYFVDYEHYADDINRMNLDIISGEAPDIIVAYGEMPFESYVSKGLIEPLDEYFNNDTELTGTSFLQNVFDCGKRNGKLYTLIPKFAIETCMADADLLQGEELTLSNYKEICKSRNIDPSMMMGELTKEDAEALYSLSVLEYVDTEKGSCDFNNQGFIDLLEYVKGLPESERDEISDSIYREKKALLYPVGIYTTDDYVWAKKGFFDGDVVFNGLPAFSGAENFIEIPFQLAISSTCKNKSAAWEFIRYFLTDEYQENLDCYMPVSEKAFNAALKKAQEGEYYIDENGEKQEIKETITTDGVEVQLEAISEEEARQIADLVRATTKAYKDDEAITSIIAEEASAYFADQKSVEEVAGIIQSRVSIYLSENS